VAKGGATRDFAYTVWVKQIPLRFLAVRTNGLAYATVLRLSVVCG